jgi:hypothetical protein
MFWILQMGATGTGAEVFEVELQLVDGISV